jgi:GAF domain-containing protein
LTVPTDRVTRILARLSSADGAENAGTQRLCTVAAEVTALSGAGIMLMVGNEPHTSICTTGGVSALIEELQYTLGEGPCVDAYRFGHPVLEPDLEAPRVARWPAFSHSAVAGGARAVFGFPMSVGSVRLGALNLYRDRPGPLTTEQHSDAAILAAVAGRALITMQTGAAPGTLDIELEAGSNLRLVVHQATGMVAEQLAITVTEALLRLRAHAFTEDRALTDVANDVVTGRVRFGQSPGDSPDP